MNLNFNINLAKGYKSNSQIARRLTEDWVVNNSYCPNCGDIRETARIINPFHKTYRCLGENIWTWYMGGYHYL